MKQIKAHVKPFTISEITDEAITFSNGQKITFDHEQDCCEWNYADFGSLDDIAKNYQFKGKLQFEAVDCGFRFGDSRAMFFVPCYSEQNGYYTNAVDIYLDGKCVCNTCGDEDYS